MNAGRILEIFSFETHVVEFSYDVAELPLSFDEPPETLRQQQPDQLQWHPSRHWETTQPRGVQYRKQQSGDDSRGSMQVGDTIQRS